MAPALDESPATVNTTDPRHLHGPHRLSGMNRPAGAWGEHRGLPRVVLALNRPLKSAPPMVALSGGFCRLRGPRRHVAAGMPAAARIPWLWRLRGSTREICRQGGMTP